MAIIRIENSLILSTTLVVIGVFAIPCLEDYKQWLEIEVPGGLPANRFGYLLSWLLTLTFRRDCRDPTSVYYDDPNGFLDPNGIPIRRDPLPEMARWSIPHRQVSQTAFDLEKDYTSASNVSRFFGTLVNKNKHYFIGTSRIEKDIPAVFYKTSISKNEVIHRHVKDGSFHITLHCQDARIVVKKKWGELFPIPPYNKRTFEEVVLLYAPQSMEDYKILEKIANAAIKHFDSTK